ncbi:MAG TPA: DEAD/DEAH box helicase [Acidimicrobiales bacterium]|nr:DEAD/DEAH box helicase [Acidimicrobiales bacterium]
MELEELVTRLGTGGRLVHLERLPARAPRYAEPARPLPPAVAERLPPRLWSHQAAAIDLARAGRSVAVATGTASGKSLCYQAPIAEAALGLDPSGRRDGPGTALVLYPTKALAQDQLRALTALDLPEVVAACYDGDTGPEERAWARRNASVLLTNPDMLHAGLLPHHGRWATFLMRLRYVVVDELHVMRGIFGSHVAQVLRRLRRLCAHYGADPTFIFSSATIGQPDALASALSGLEVTAVTDDGSPAGERLFALWNPPLLDEGSGARASAHGETAALLAELVRNGSRAIAFCRSRKGTEVVAATTRRRVGDQAELVRPYRGGYLAAERRAIEAELFGGRLRAVVATSALELGVDVGGLDACVLDGFPGTIASMWQQAGRAGRDQQRSLAVLVAGDDQLDQWLMGHPDEVFSRQPEPAVVNPSNPYVLLPHLACAAFELPLGHDDERWWGDDLSDGVRRLVQSDHLRVREQRGYWAGHGSPAGGVGLRSSSSVEYRIAEADGRLVGTVDAARAFDVVHPGAVYLHQGQAWKVDDLDLDDHVAWVSRSAGDEVTQVRSETDIRILTDEQSVPAGRARLHLGEVEVVTTVVGYQRRDAASGEVLGTEALDLPESRLVTRAFWYVVEPKVLDDAGITPGGRPAALHAAEHAAIGLLPLFTICDRWDVGGVSTAVQPDTGRPTIVVYDGYPGGAGIAELGFEAGTDLLTATLETVAGCPCGTGCPSCVQSPKCGNLNEQLDKGGAVALLDAVLGVATTRRSA